MHDCMKCLKTGHGAARCKTSWQEDAPGESTANHEVDEGMQQTSPGVFSSACEQSESVSLDACGSFCNSEDVQAGSPVFPSDSDVGPRKGLGIGLRGFCKVLSIQ
jgi:hypothetical protein